MIKEYREYLIHMIQEFQIRNIYESSDLGMNDMKFYAHINCNTVKGKYMIKKIER